MEEHIEVVKTVDKVLGNIHEAKMVSYDLVDILLDLNDYPDVDAVYAVRALLTQADTILKNLVYKHNDLALNLAKQDFEQTVKRRKQEFDQTFTA